MKWWEMVLTPFSVVLVWPVRNDSMYYRRPFGQQSLLSHKNLKTLNIGTVETDFGRFFEKVDKEKFTWVAWDPPGYGKSRPPDRVFKGCYPLADAHYAAKLMKVLIVSLVFLIK